MASDQQVFHEQGNCGFFGKWLLFIGALAFGAAGVLTPPVHYIGYGLSFLGLCLLRFPMHRFPLRWPMLALMGWLVIVAIYAPDTGTKKWHNLLYGMPVILVGWGIGQHRSALTMFIIGVMVGVMLSGTLALLQYTIGLEPDSKPFRIGRDGERHHIAFGFMGHHIRFGTSMALASMVLLILGRFIFPKKWWIIPSVMSLCAIILSGSRGALMAIIGGVGLWVGSTGTIKRMAIAAGSVLGLSALAGLIIVLTLTEHRIQELLTFNNPRFEVWTGTVTLIQDYPWFGVGPRGFSAIYIPGMEAGRYTLLSDMGASTHAHNTVLHTAATIGLPGLVLVLWLLSAAIRHLWRHRKTSALAWTFGMAIFGIFIFGGLTEDYLGLTTMRSFFFSALGVALGLAQLPQAHDTPQALVDGTNRN